MTVPTKRATVRKSALAKLAALIAVVFAILSILSSCAPIEDPSPGGNTPEAGLAVYFMDVGQADSALVCCDGAHMLIDGGNVADSNLVYSFLEKHGADYLEYIVATHAHEDHVGGLSGALNYAKAGTALCPVMEFDSKAFGNFKKYLGQQGVEITVPQPGDTFKLGGADVEILGPINETTNTNNTSIVMRIVYGDTSILFTGDAEREEEADILEAGYDISSTILKVGHHGSETSTSYPFLREVMPQYAVISVGAKNSYGHPDEDTLSRLRDAGATVYRTDTQGTVTCTSDGKTVTFQTERNAGAASTPTAPPSSPEATGTAYIGNIRSHKFHRPECSGLPDEKNRTQFTSRAEAVNAGYDPCGICKP
jgi:competence protein ComEC